MELKDKYIFRPYSPIFPKLFEKEKDRIQKIIGPKVLIEHIGSTAVPGLGGKGVIDISLAAPKSDWQNIKTKLKITGYDYKKKEPEREKERLFLMANLPDKELGTRIYHIHLTYPESTELKKEIGFRDYLRNHPKELSEYAEIKKDAATNAQKFNTKDEMRDAYAATKNKFIENIINKIN